jgi:hypothetical protein
MAARLLHAPPPLAARGLTRHRKKSKKTRDLVWFPPLFTSPPAVRIPVIRKSRKRRKTVGFNFSFLFRSALVPLFFRSISSADPFFSFFCFAFFSVSGGWRYVQGRAATEFLSCLCS